jgi:ribosomal protein L37E
MRIGFFERIFHFFGRHGDSLRLNWRMGVYGNVPFVVCMRCGKSYYQWKSKTSARVVAGFVQEASSRMKIDPEKLDRLLGVRQ